MLSYTELMDILDDKNILQKDLAESLEMSRVGFKGAIENGTLQISKVNDLCRIIGISPNDFFCYSGSNGNHQTQNGGIGNTQIVETGFEALKEQLKAKDSQIDRLLKLLEK